MTSFETAYERRTAAATLLLGPSRIQRTGIADPLDDSDWLLREGWRDHLARLGECPRGGLWLIDVLAEAELEGRGGGGFPTARKWRRALSGGVGVTVVANGSESEPLSAKDATLLRQRPHLVLDGLSLAAETLHATRAVVWLHDDDLVTRLVVEDALAERRRHVDGHLPFDVVTVPRRYIAGESSTIANALSGGPLLPRFRGHGARAAIERCSTVVNNVETLARVALAARGAAGAAPGFRDGSRDLAGSSTLVTVLTPTDRHVLELTRDETIAAAVAMTSWPSGEPAAVLIGGFSGRWSRWADVADVGASEVALRSVGATLGPGIVAPLSPVACGLAETAAMVAYMEASSAGQCGPCRFGLSSLASRLERLRVGRDRRGVLRRIAEDLADVEGRGACHHPDGVVRLVSSALDAFRDDVKRHTEGRPCRNAGMLSVPVPRIA